VENIQLEFMSGMRTYAWNVEQIETAVLKVINCSEASNSEIGTRERYSVDCLSAEERVCQRLKSATIPESKGIK
jgi:hypothetical protein